MIEFTAHVQSRGNKRLTVEITKEMRDKFEAGDMVIVTIKKIKEKN